MPPTPDPVYRSPAGPVVSRSDEVDLPAARVGEPGPGGSSVAPASEKSVTASHQPARTPEADVAESRPSAPSPDADVAGSRPPAPSPDADVTAPHPAAPSRDVVAPTGSAGRAPDAARERTSAARRVLRRRVRLVRRHLGSGPYLDYGGELLAQLAAHGSASAFVADPTRAEAVRREAPGCPVHTNPDAIPAGVFRGVLAVTAGPPDAATLATWRRVLVPDGGRVLLIGVAPELPGGFTVRWTGQERWRCGPAVVVLEAAPGRMIEP